MRIDIQSAAPPLKPGETGMKTNGPAELWYRINEGDWKPVHEGLRKSRSLYVTKGRIERLLDPS